MSSKQRGLLRSRQGRTSFSYSAKSWRKHRRLPHSRQGNFMFSYSVRSPKPWTQTVKRSSTEKQAKETSERTFRNKNHRSDDYGQQPRQSKNRRQIRGRKTAITDGRDQRGRTSEPHQGEDGKGEKRSAYRKGGIGGGEVRRTQQRRTSAWIRRRAARSRIAQALLLPRLSPVPPIVLRREKREKEAVKIRAGNCSKGSYLSRQDRSVLVHST